MPLSTLLTPNQSDELRALLKGPFVNTNDRTLHTYLDTLGVRSGAWWVLQGDGNVPSGSASLTLVGSPASESLTLGGNTISALALNGSSQYAKTADVASPLGDFTTMAFMRRRTIGVVQAVVAKMSSVGGGPNYALNHAFDAANLSTATLYKTSGEGTAINSSGTTHLLNAWHSIGLPYDFVADTTSIGRLHRDGVAVGAGSTSMRGPMQAAASAGWWVGASGFGGGSSFLHGDVFCAFMTEAALTAAQLLQVHDYLKHWVPVSGATLTVFSRGDVRFNFTPTATTSTALRTLVDALSSDNGIRLHIREAANNSGLTMTHGNGSGTNETASGALSWVIGTTYAIRAQWKADGSATIWRDGTVVASSTGRNVPTAFPATIGVGALADGTLSGGGVVDNFKWLA